MHRQSWKGKMAFCHVITRVHRAKKRRKHGSTIRNVAAERHKLMNSWTGGAAHRHTPTRQSTTI